ncbi:uncharacterized protein HaLaN_21605, partial [Haematococcus lacustris]
MLAAGTRVIKGQTSPWLRATCCKRNKQSCAAQTSSRLDIAAAQSAPLDALTYVELWHAAIRAGRIEQAGELFHRQASLWGTPSQHVYTRIISQLLKVRPKRGVPQRRLAYQLWRELHSCHGTRLDVASVRAGVSACAHAGKMHEAEQLIGWARSRGMRGMLNAYNRLLAVYAGRGDMAAVKRVYKQLKEQRYLPDLGSSGAVQVTWNILVWGYAHAGDLATAKAVLGEAEDHGFKPDAWTWSSLLHACAKVGDPLPASATAPLVSAHAYAALVDGYMRAGNVPAAERAAQRLSLEAGLPPNAVVFNTLIRGYCKLGMWGQARAMQ